MNKQQLANKIWETANKMRSKIDANDYKDYILGFIFYKFLSEYELEYIKKLFECNDTNKNIKELFEDIDEEDIIHIKAHVGYYISYEHLFSTWIEKKQNNKFLASDVTKALNTFDNSLHKNYKKIFEHIFNTLQVNLSKLGDNENTRTVAIKELLDPIQQIPSIQRKQDYDMLGFIYEYLIEKFASNAGKKAGEFYTPHEVSLLISEIVAHHLKDKKFIEIYDPTSGSGSLLINIGRAVEKYIKAPNSVIYYAQEIIANTYNLTRMNLIMRGIQADNIITRNGDTLAEDWPLFDDSNPGTTYKKLLVDAVVSNPPYSQQWDNFNQGQDPRFEAYGLAPKGKADYAFLLHDLFHLNSDGIMAIVLPHGVLFRGNEEGNIRKNLIEQNKIDAIIGLPDNIFFGTSIPTIIMILKQHKKNSDILFIDASKDFEKQDKKNVLRACDIKKIFDTYVNRNSIKNYAKLVSKEEIRENDYNLNIPRYIEIENETEENDSCDLFSSIFGGIPKHELSKFNDYWNEFPSLYSELFKDINTEYTNINITNIKQNIKNNEYIKQYIKNFTAIFNDVDQLIFSKSLENFREVDLISAEQNLIENLFKKFEQIKIIDKYHLYQSFAIKWQGLASDIEILQGKNSSIEEWKHDIFSDELVKQFYFNDDLKEIKKKTDELNKLDSQLNELVEELSEDAKKQDFVNEKLDGFKKSEVKKALKNKDLESETKIVLQKAEKIFKQQEVISLETNKLKKELDKKVFNLISNITDEQIKELLNFKWIKPLKNSLLEKPREIFEIFANKIICISQKYSSTYDSIMHQITNTEKELISMIDELEGNEFDNQALQELKKLLGEK